MPKANGINVELDADKNLRVVGTDLVIENPLVGKGLELDLGQLWQSIWVEGLHNNPNPARLRALLLNAAQLSVSKVISILKEGV